MPCVAGHQCNLYPYGGFFAKAASVAHFVIVDTTQYVKKQFQNRNKVKLSNGEEHWLSIPVKTKGRFSQALNEVEIKEGTHWQKDHVRCLEVNYRRCRFFDPRGRFFCLCGLSLISDFFQLFLFFSHSHFSSMEFRFKELPDFSGDLIKAE